MHQTAVSQPLHVLVAKTVPGSVAFPGGDITDTILHVMVNLLQGVGCVDDWKEPPGPGQLRPGVVVVQLPVKRFDERPRRLNNKFGTMNRMVNNRKAQLRNRGDSGKF